MFKFKPNYFFDAPTVTGEGGGKIENLSKDDIIDFLNVDEGDVDIVDIDEKPKKDTKEKTDSKSKETIEKEEDTDDKETDEDTEEDVEEELKALEEELEEPTEEQLELVTPARRRDILKKYPQLFKDFPYLEKAYYREQQFTEITPTIKDAKEAVEKAQVLDAFEADITKGDTEKVLAAVKQHSPEAFNALVDNYLSTLAKVDEGAFHHVIGNVTKHTIMAMVKEGRSSGNKVLENAAAILNQFIFGTSDFKPPAQLSTGKKDNSEVDEVKAERQKFVQEKFDSHQSELDTKINNTLKNTIEQHIDPKESMTDYVRRNASRDALDDLQKLIVKDTRFKALTEKLWERVFETNFSKDSLDKVKSAYLSKAKTLLPAVIKKARNEALRGMGKRVKDDTTDTVDRKGPVTQGRPRSQSNTGKISKASDIPKGMSTLDFLNSD